MRSLEYPVIFMGKTFIHGQNYSNRDLCIRTIGSFNNRIYDDAIIIDSKGNTFKVRSYTNSFPITIIATNIIDLIFDCFMREKEELCTWINYELTAPKKLNFQEIKNLISKLINANPSWFKKTLEDFDCIETKLSSYETLPEMINLFAGYP